MLLILFKNHQNLETLNHQNPAKFRFLRNVIDNKAKVYKQASLYQC